MTDKWEKVFAKLAPRAILAIRDGFAGADAVFERFQVNTPIRQSHFLAQVLNETGGFRIIEENLNYSAVRMCQVWPSRFPTIESAQPYVRNPEALANKTYGGRMGNDLPGDGWRYRGRGLLQLTGREAYRLVGRAIGVDLESDPDAAMAPGNLLSGSLAIWNAKKCSVYADMDDLRKVTKLVNGGYIGLKERGEWLAKAKETLHA